MATAQTLQPGDVLAGNFRIEELIGEGGMGVVYKGTNLGTGAECVVKVILPHLAEGPGVLYRFKVEAKVGSKIGRSPHIVDVIFAGVDEGRRVPFLVMELLTGESLAEHIARGPVDPVLVRTVIDQLAEALDQAHRAGVVHRDLKPSNLHVTVDWKGRHGLKVLDFGIAKVLEGDLRTATGMGIGTPVYAAPEQHGQLLRNMAQKRGIVIAESVSRQTDLWPFGLVVYEMLTGLTASQYWDVSTASDVSLALNNALEARPPATARAGERARLLPAGFDGWFAKCVEVDATRRWESAGAAATAFLAMYREQRKSSRPPGPAAATPPVARPAIVETHLHGVPELDPSKAVGRGPAPEPKVRVPAGVAGVRAEPGTRLHVEEFDARSVPGARVAPAGGAWGRSLTAIAVVGGVGLLGIAGMFLGLRGGASATSMEPRTVSPDADPPRAEATVPASPAPVPATVGSTVGLPAVCAAGMHFVTGTGCVTDIVAGQVAPVSAAPAPVPSSRPVSPPSPVSAAPARADTAGGEIRAAGLVWQRERSSDSMSWAAAKAYCAGQPAGPWRLPSKDELLALLESRAVKERVVFWSSTLVADSPSSAWYVGFSFRGGGAGSDVVSSSSWVRCVR